MYESTEDTYGEIEHLADHEDQEEEQPAEDRRAAHVAERIHNLRDNARCQRKSHKSGVRQDIRQVAGKPVVDGTEASGQFSEALVAASSGEGDNHDAGRRDVQTGLNTYREEHDAGDGDHPGELVEYDVEPLAAFHLSYYIQYHAVI